MRIWLLRSLVFLLLTLGAAAVGIIIYHHTVEREDMRMFHGMHRAEELKQTGQLLLEWHLGQADAARERFLQEQRDKGSFFTLLGAHGEVLAGGQPDKDLLALAERARQEQGYVWSENGRGYRPSPPRMPLESIVFQGRDGDLYTLCLRNETSDMRNFGPPPPLVFIVPGAFVAVLVLYALFRISSASFGELRSALSRLAQGDFGVRVDAALERRSDSFAKLAKDFNRTVTVLADRQAEQRYLLSELTHEMRSPLTRMTLAMELANTANHDRTMQLLQRFKADSDRLHALSVQLMDFVRLQWDAGETAPLRLVGILDSLAREGNTEAATRQKKVQFTYNADCWVLGNAVQLESMVRNILRNAVRHSSEHSSVRMTLDSLEEDKMARIVISDRGPGIPSDMLERVFEPFYQGSDCRGEAGLGLTIARHVVEKHNGSITLSNSETGGLQATILLPLLASAPEAANVAVPVSRQA